MPFLCFVRYIYPRNTIKMEKGSAQGTFGFCTQNASPEVTNRGGDSKWAKSLLGLEPWSPGDQPNSYTAQKFWATWPALASKNWPKMTSKNGPALTSKNWPKMTSIDHHNLTQNDQHWPANIDPKWPALTSKNWPALTSTSTDQQKLTQNDQHWPAKIDQKWRALTTINWPALTSKKFNAVWPGYPGEHRCVNTYQKATQMLEKRHVALKKTLVCVCVRVLRVLLAVWVCVTMSVCICISIRACFWTCAWNFVQQA